MTPGETTRLQRDCPATIIPGGHTLTLPAGTQVTLLEVLPEGVTVRVGAHGSAALILRAHTGALGELQAPLAPAAAAPPTAAPGPLEEKIWAKLRSCFDPEIPVNIVELGLVYGCRVESGAAGARVTVDLTLTAPGCSMGDILKSDIEGKVLSIEGVDTAEVVLVMDPPWDPSRMSEAARLELGFL